MNGPVAALKLVIVPFAGWVTMEYVSVGLSASVARRAPVSERRSRVLCWMVNGRSRATGACRSPWGDGDEHGRDAAVRPARRSASNREADGPVEVRRRGESVNAPASWCS